MYQDAKGTLEIVDSAANTAPLGAIITGVAEQNQLLTLDPANIIELDGLSNALASNGFSYQWQADSGDGFANIVGASSGSKVLAAHSLTSMVRPPKPSPLVWHRQVCSYA
ncbi:hypothetical protein D3C85_1198460 [compost metagenome]